MNEKLYFLLILIISCSIVSFMGCVFESEDYADNYDLKVNDSNLNSSNDTNDNLNSTKKNIINKKLKNTSKYEFEGKCYKVVDGDTIDVEGIGRIRFVGVNTPERGENGYKSAKEYVKNKCLEKTVYLDIDDRKNKDRYNRTLAVVYTDDGQNLNHLLLKENHAEIMYIPPSEFYPYDWQ